MWLLNGLVLETLSRNIFFEADDFSAASITSMLISEISYCYSLAKISNNCCRWVSRRGSLAHMTPRGALSRMAG
eukprot:12362527-Heterocapsa_arctica.AAC.1